MPLFSFGRVPLAPSLLTGNGSHMVLWTSILLHLAALGLTLAANIVYFVEDRNTSLDLLKGWAISSMAMQSAAVLGTVIVTGFVRDVFSTPLTNTLGFGLFLGSVLATAKISYAHSGMEADSAEVILYNLALFFQAFAIGSLISNGLCALANKGGL